MYYGMNNNNAVFTMQNAFFLHVGRSARGRQRARTSRERQSGSTRGVEYNYEIITMQSLQSARGRQRGSRGGRGRGQGCQSRVTPSSLPWREVRPETDTAPPRLHFSEEIGPTIQMPPGAQPVEFFRHLFDDSVLQLIVDETNR